MKTQIDHLVIVAKTLEFGVQWCEATLGVTPGPGGEHALYGTHNRLLKIATPTHPLAYLEIIAINPGAKRTASATTQRWFDMDDAALQAAVTKAPRLMHFVASTDEIQAARIALKAQGIERDEAGRVVLIVGFRRVGFHGGDVRIVEADPRFAAGRVDAALVKFHAHRAGDVLLRFLDVGLERVAFGRIPEAVVNEFRVFRDEAVAQVLELVDAVEDGLLGVAPHQQMLGQTLDAQGLVRANHLQQL